MHFKVGTETMEFPHLSLYGRIKSEALSETTLRQNIAEKIKSKRRAWEVVLSPQYIDTDDKLKFLEKFFYSPNREISLDGTNWRKVTIQAGDFPIEYVEGAKFVKLIKFNLISKEPSEAYLIGEKYTE